MNGWSVTTEAEDSDSISSLIKPWTLKFKLSYLTFSLTLRDYINFL